MQAELGILRAGWEGRADISIRLSGKDPKVAVRQEPWAMRLARAMVLRLDKLHLRPLAWASSEREYHLLVKTSSKRYFWDALPLAPLSLALQKYAQQHSQNRTERVRAIARESGIAESQQFKRLDYAMFVFEDAIEATMRQLNLDMRTWRSMRSRLGNSSINVTGVVDALNEAMFLDVFAMYLISNWRDVSRSPMFLTICDSLPSRADSLFLELGSYAYADEEIALGEQDVNNSID
jgi:hypothetical protein